MPSTTTSSPPHISLTILSRINGALSESVHPAKVVIWAIASLAFFRLGELLVETAESYNPTTHLSRGDVGVDDMSQPSMVKVHLHRSKCDQFGKGVDVIVGRYGTPICPVVATTPRPTSPGETSG